jgi:hypothetical protein
MNRTVRIALAVSIGVGLATGVTAQGRHDEKPHGYDAKVASERVPPPVTPEKYVVLPSGPRGHDNPLRGRKIAISPKRIDKSASGQGSERK